MSHDVKDTVITRPAALVTQGKLKIYSTSLRVKDLRIPNFYKIDTLDPKDDKGYQRILNESRARRLSEYLIEAFRSKDAFLPTSVFLATDKDISFDEKTNIISFDVSKVGPFNVVDGQHRIAGLVEAAKEIAEMNDFEIPVNIAVNLDAVSQMCHFLIVNTTQKSVDTAVEQQIVARLTDMLKLEKMPTIPRWIQRQVDKGGDARALVFADYLNTEPGSVWVGKIRMANDEDEERTSTINQKSFVKSIKSYVISANNPFGNPDFESGIQPKILSNYWKAIAELLCDPSSEEETVLFKTVGVDLFHMVSAAVFRHLARDGDYQVSTIKGILERAFGQLPPENIGIATREWWLSGHGASDINSGAVRKLATTLNHAIDAQAMVARKVAV